MELRASRSLSEIGLGALAPISSHLEVLDLADSPTLPTEALAAILRRTGPGCGARLRVLTLRACALAVTDDLLAGFLPRAHGLRSLDLTLCSSITDLTAMCLANARSRALKHLRHLDITGCERLTARGWEKLRRTAHASAGGAEAEMQLTGYDPTNEEATT